MAIKIEATKELVSMVNLAARAWKVDPNRQENDVHFDVYCEREYGLKVEFSVAQENIVIVEGATIFDEEKYVTFLLKFGNMHDE